MLRRNHIVYSALAIGLACKGSPKPDPTPAPAPITPAIADAAANDARPVDAASTAVAAPREDTPPAPSGEPPDDVLLVVSGLPDRARVIANRVGPSLDAHAPLDGKFVGGFLVARHLADPVPPTLAAWRGHPIALRDENGVACTATVASAVALRSGLFWYPMSNSTQDPAQRDGLLNELWAGRPTYGAPSVREHESIFTAFSLAGETPACATAFYATRTDRAIKTVKVKAAKPDVETAAYAAFDSLGWVGNARSKAALEKLSGVETISVRMLDGGSGPSLVLVYANVNDHRRIAVWSMPPRSDETAPPELVEIGPVEAPAPSRVVGFDIDRDGAIDAVIGHASGAAIIFGKKPGVAFDIVETYCPLTTLDDRHCARPAPAEAPLY